MKNNKIGKRPRKVHKRKYFRKFFCLFFACTNVLLIGTIVLVKHMSIDYYSVNDLLQHIFPSIFILGSLGWLAGLILDNPKKNLIIDYKDLVMEELIKANSNITPEELERKLKHDDDYEDEDDENFSFEDADFNIQDAKIDL